MFQHFISLSDDGRIIIIIIIITTTTTVGIITIVNGQTEKTVEKMWKR